MSREEWWLAFYLRLVGVILLLAFVAVVMPFEWMAAAHRQMGMGELTETPLVNYLTRSLSALYAMLGLFMFALAKDIRRYAPFISFLGIAYLGFGLFMVLLDSFSGMPLWWVLLEGPTVMVSGTIILFLHRRASSRHAEESRP